MRLGFVAYGGPPAHIAMMEERFVRQRAWLTRERFLDLVGAVNLLPGPSSTELAIYLGEIRGDWPGLIVAGACFILPAALLTGALAWAYREIWHGAAGGGPAVRNQAGGGGAGGAGGLESGKDGAAERRADSSSDWSCGAGDLRGAHTGAVALGAGFLWLVMRAGRNLAGKQPRGDCGLIGTLTAGGAAVPLGAVPVLLYFLKIGAVLFGSGYVLLPVLRADLVVKLHWLSDAQLLDAIAVSQATPGPFFTVATFIGFLLAGWKGAALATLGMFLPAFVYVGATSGFCPSCAIRRWPVPFWMA